MSLVVEILLLLLIGGPFVAGGAHLIYRSVRASPRLPEDASDLPRAQLVTGAHNPLHERRGVTRRALVRFVQFTFGLASLTFGVLVIIAFTVVLLWLHG